jgi:hypothetical protein
MHRSGVRLIRQVIIDLSGMSCLRGRRERRRIGQPIMRRKVIALGGVLTRLRGRQRRDWRRSSGQSRLLHRWRDWLNFTQSLAPGEPGIRNHAHREPRRKGGGDIPGVEHTLELSQSQAHHPWLRRGTSFSRACESQGTARVAAKLQFGAKDGPTAAVATHAGFPCLPALRRRGQRLEGTGP